MTVIQRIIYKAAPSSKWRRKEKGDYKGKTKKIDNIFFTDEEPY